MFGYKGYLFIYPSNLINHAYTRVKFMILYIKNLENKLRG